MQIFGDIVDAINSNLISGGAYFRIIKAVAVTAVITLTAWIVAMVVGIVLSYLTCYEKKVVSVIGRALCFITRSVPVLLVMYLLYYKSFFGAFLPSTIAAGLSIGLYGAGSFSEILTRAAKKEMADYSEAVVDRLKKSHFSAVIPEAVEKSLFDIKRLTVLLLQFSTVAGYIGAGELVTVMTDIGHRNMYPIFSILFCMTCYLIVAAIIEAIFNHIIKKNAQKQEETQAPDGE